MMVLVLGLVCLAVGPDGRGVITASEAAGSFKLPEYEKFVMENGLTVYLLEQHEVPLIYISAVFPAGAISDGDKYGLASLTADGLLFGTKNYAKKEIEDKLDFIGATYYTYASKEYAEISMSFVNTDRETVFPILKDIVIDPIFDEEEFEKRKKRLLVELERAKERPRQVIRAYYEKFLFADHAYGNPVSGTRESVAAITAKDLKEFYKTNYYPAGAAIAVAGDFDTKKMTKEITKLFEDWKVKGTPTSIAEASIPTPDKSKLLLVNKDDATETRFYIGSLGIKRSNPDYVAIQVVNTILGGRFTSWLNDELRINRGLTYGARSGFREHKYSGTFTIRSFTKTATTIEAIDVALEILEKLHKQGIDEETLTSAKNYINGQFPPDYETAGELAGLLTEMFIYGFDESFINNFQKNVDEMTVEKSRDIVNKYFPKDNLQFVLICKADEIREDVAKYGEITEKEIKDVGF
jgi:predicted Zn-dependent peptidase